MTGSPVTEAELHAYADGLLPEGDHDRLESWLAENPVDAARVAEWQGQNAGIKALFADYARPEATDVEMVQQSRDPRAPAIARYAFLACATVIVFAAGAAAGHYGPGLFEPPAVQLTAAEILPKEAQSAFLVYAGEVRHPVEVFANEEAHLATWLGKRLAIPDLKVPNLQPLGFRLVGGRLLPVNGNPGAMFMFEDLAGERLTVLVGRNRENRTTSFRFASLDNLETFYWIDGELGYAVTGEISRDKLRKVAEECYRQFPS